MTSTRWSERMHGHIVQFYAADEELVDGIGRFLAEAVLDGGAAAVVATAPHRAALEAAMESNGVDVAAGVSEGAICLLDAAETMGSFLLDGSPDPLAFRQVVGEKVKSLVGRGGPTHLYGEMVDLLWDSGRRNAALDLERLWNELRAEIPFSLFCAYREDPTAAEQHEKFRQVRELHSAVFALPPPGDVPPRAGSSTLLSERMGFPAELSSPRRARTFVTDLLRPLAGQELVSDAALVISELAANSVVHAGSPFEVTLEVRCDAVCLTVSEAAALSKSPGQLTPVTGHGLGLVDVLADRWEAEMGEQGTTVRVQLPAPS